MAVNTLECQYWQNGVEIDYTPGSDLAAGVPTQIGSGTSGIVGIPKEPIEANRLGSLCIAGVFKCLKVEGALAVGTKVGWDANGTPYGGSATGAITATVANWDFPLGTVVLAAVSATDIAYVLINRWPNEDILEEYAAIAHIADVAATIGTLTNNISPTNAADDTVADVTLPAAITDNSGGVDPGDNTIAAVTNITAIDTSNMDDGSADNILVAIGDTTAVNQSANLEVNFDKIADEINAQATANTAILAAVAQLAAKANVTRTAVSVLEDNQADFGALLAEAKVDIDALVAKVNAILVALETAEITASS